MVRNKKGIVITAAVVLVILSVFAVAYVSGNGISNRFLGKNLEKPEQTKQPNNAEKLQMNEETQNSTQKQTLEKSSDVQPEKANDQSAASKNRFKEIKAKAIYVTGSTAGEKSRLDKIIQLVKTTELNAVVLDVKDDGKVNYPSEVPEVKKDSTFHKLYDVDSVLKKLHDNNIYVIGRIVCFRDPLLANKRADLAIKRPNGQIWRENGKIAWTNPYNEEVWKYNIDIAKEAIDKGFDEIQFDYVRFPTARKTDVDFGQNPAPKADIICNFLKTAYHEIHEVKGITLSADVFGIICESPGDFENIGQDIERVGKDIDYICPMIYPSHYANAAHNGSGQSINGVTFTAPDLKPYDVVYQSLVKAKNRIAKTGSYKAKVRPYLQDFTASWLPKGYYQNYGADQVRQQIKAVYDAGYDEWILWDAANTYTEAALNKE